MTTADAKSSRRANRGVSLVEVLVVIVLLVIGIFAIAAIFPGGFASINFTGNANLANALIRQNEEYLRGHRENLPNGIVAVDPVTGLIRLGLTPNDLRGNTDYAGNAGATVVDPRFSGANRQRRVMGESLIVPPPTPNWPGSGETVSLYHALLAPIYSDVPFPGSSLGVAAYSGTAMDRVIFQDPPTEENWTELQRLGATAYGIDYERGILYYLGVPIERAFKIEFIYRTTPDRGVQGAADNVLLIPSATLNARLSLDLHVAPTFPLPAGATIDPGTDFLFRRFNQLGVAQPFSSDPYEFKIYDTVYGLFGFNPIGATIPTPSTQGRGLTVQLDYDVDDWHILRQDVQVPLERVDDTVSPGTGFHALKLSTGHIKRIGDAEDTINFLGGAATNNSYEYAGLVRYYPAEGPAPARNGTPGIDLVLVDMQTGFQLDSRTLQRPGESPVPLPGSSDVNGMINYRTGVIHLRESITLTAPGGAAATLTVPAAGRSFRVFYRDSNDFAVATRKPFLRYYEQPNPALLEHRQFTQLPNGYLIFPALDGEKTVAVDYSYMVEPNGPATRQVLTRQGELHQVQAPGTFGSPPVPAWWVRVSHADGADSNADPAVLPDSIRIRGVRGASIHTWVTFRDGRTLRHRERSTILSREQTR